MTTLAENTIATVKMQHRQIRGLSVIKVNPGDKLRVIGEDRTGLFIACRFDNCADTEELHDAFFGLLFIDKNNLFHA